MNIFKSWVNSIFDDSINLLDVTELFQCDFAVRSNAIKKIEINVDNLPIRLRFDMYNFDCRIFALSKKIKETVVVDKSYRNNTLKISIRCKANFNDKKAYFDFVVPHINELKIKSINGDVILKNVCAEIMEIDSECGDVQIIESVFKKCISCTKSSDINMNLIENNYNITANTKRGDVILNNAFNNSNSQNIIICNSDDGDIIIGIP